MLSRNLLHVALKGLRLAAPFVFWTFTAAPSFVNSGQQGSFDLAAYSSLSSGSNSLADKLFEQASYEPVIDKAVEEIYIALSNHELNKALDLSNRLLAEFPNFYLGHMLKGDILSLKAGRPLTNIGDMPNVPTAKKKNLPNYAKKRSPASRPSRTALNATCCLLNWCN